MKCTLLLVSVRIEVARNYKAADVEYFLYIDIDIIAASAHINLSCF
jgi:hypothetical protein